MAENPQNPVEPFVLPDLEIQCEQCNGTRGYRDAVEHNGWADCPYCDGSGYKPTPIGARILDLIRHNSRVKISAELQVSSAR